MDNMLFEEIQGFAKKLSRFFPHLSVLLFLVYGCCFYLFGRDENSNLFIGILPALIVAAILLYFFGKAALTTQIRTDGIYIRFFPFHRTFKRYAWNTIDEVYIRQYNPLREYGGWGIRMGPSGSAYNISGNKGIQLVFKNGKRLLIGTNAPDDLGAVLMKIGKLNVVSHS